VLKAGNQHLSTIDADGGTADDAVVGYRQEGTPWREAQPDLLLGSPERREQHFGENSGVCQLALKELHNSVR